MIIATKSLDTKVRQAFGKQNVGIYTIDIIKSHLSLDPEVTKPRKEAFIVSSTDLRNAKIKQEFLAVAAAKHPKNIVILCVRKREEFVEGNGIDKVLVDPKPAEIAAAVEHFVTEFEKKEQRTNIVIDEPARIEPYRPEANDITEEEATALESIPVSPTPVETKGMHAGVASSAAVKETAEYAPSTPHSKEGVGIGPVITELEEEVKAVSIPEPAESVEVIQHTTIADRVRNCNSVADVAVLTKQLTASELLKDIVKDNKQYVMVEERLKGLQEKLYAIFADADKATVEDKLERVSAILLDKTSYRIHNNTIIEQRVNEIINTITSQVKGLVQTRLAELDRAILNTKSTGMVDYARLAGITDERANLLLEIATLSAEVNEIYQKTDSFAGDVTTKIAEGGEELSGDPLLDAHLRMRHSSVITGASRDSIMNILQTADQNSEEFKEALRNLNVMYKKLNKLIEVDKESIAALTQAVAYLKANRIEDTVVAETLLKKSMRIFIADEGVGRTAVPYILSKKKSRQNANVLYVDLTGASKIEGYTDQYISLEEFMSTQPEKDFCAVVGNPVNSMEVAQKLLVSFVKAADFYRVINVVMAPEQMELFDVIAEDALVVNYVVEPKLSCLRKFREVINITKKENVAQRVIINKCDVQTRPILETLGVIDRIDLHLARIPYIPQIQECTLMGVSPDLLTVVSEGFAEVSKVC